MATDYLRWADRNWGLLTKLMGGHAKIYRATHGVIGHRVPGAPEMLLLDHKGAKSGTHRTTPLVFARDGENTILIASKGGYPKNPAWYYNLKANPDTTIQIGSKSDRRACARGDARRVRPHVEARGGRLQRLRSLPPPHRAQDPAHGARTAVAPIRRVPADYARCRLARERAWRSPQAPSARAITICCTSSVPSPIVRIFASR